MKIFINQDEVDFTLEKEKTLTDIYHSITKWLNPQGYSITEFQVDGRDLDTRTMEEWGDVNLESDIHIAAMTLGQMKAGNLETMIKYCQMLQISLKEGNTKLLGELLKEYGYIEGSFEVLLDDHSHGIKNHLSAILEENGFMPEAEKTEDQIKTVLEAFIALEAVARERLEEIQNPGGAGKDCFESITALMPEMEELSVYLQTGKDRQAMDIIIRFTELFQKILRIYSFQPVTQKNARQEEVKVFITEISHILKELTDAFEARDLVLMGDLMEYEILPRMKSFPQLFEFPLEGQ